MKYFYLVFIIFLVFSCSDETTANKSCVNECSEKGLFCDNNKIYSCAYNADGCLDKVEVEDCLSTESICLKGMSQCVKASCDDECVAEGVSCKDENTLVFCGQFDEDSCLEYGDEITCSENEECRSGNCVLKEASCNINMDCGENSGATCSNEVCVCEEGLAYNSLNKECIDINECLVNNDGCDTNATCANTVGSFTCTCNDGYNGNGFTCDDINECLVNNGGCDTNATCENTEGSFTCTCNEGYTGGGVTCDDIDECLVDNGGCGDAKAYLCENTAGSFTCSCNEGYKLDGVICVDINECNLPGTCSSNATCENSEGSFTCTCNDGYTGGGVTCSDINECVEATDDCSQNCSNTVGSFTCSCNLGYKLNPDGKTCDDVNECIENTDACTQNCTNTTGGYTCSCDTGYELDSDGFTCDDVNECSDNNAGCDQVCNNTAGSYNCSCHEGYVLNEDGFTCDDVNECTENTDDCTQNCTNTTGGYTCSCNNGYELNGDGFTCNDIDECAENSDTCDATHYCENIDGSYDCNGCVCVTANTVNGSGACTDEVGQCECLPLFDGLKCDTSRKLKIFLTNNTYKGDLGGISGADEKCNSDQNKPDDGHYYKALIGGNNRDLNNDWVLEANMSYYRADGTTLITTTNANKWFDFSFSNSISENDSRAWTGLKSDGSFEESLGARIRICNNWNAETIIWNGKTGDTDKKDNQAIDREDKTCDKYKNLYCVEQICPQGQNYDGIVCQ
jgi:hypothetical protein